MCPVHHGWRCMVPCHVWFEHVCIKLGCCTLPKQTASLFTSGCMSINRVCCFDQADSCLNTNQVDMSWVLSMRQVCTFLHAARTAVTACSGVAMLVWVCRRAGGRARLCSWILYDRKLNQVHCMCHFMNRRSQGQKRATAEQARHRPEHHADYWGTYATQDHQTLFTLVVYLFHYPSHQTQALFSRLWTGIELRSATSVPRLIIWPRGVV